MSTVLDRPTLDDLYAISQANLKSVQRPTVLCKFYTDSIGLLYDTGAQISALSSHIFNSLPPQCKIKQLTVPFQPTCASGAALKVVGCYMIQMQVLNRQINHPFFICENLHIDGILGVDLAKRHNLSYNASTGSVFFQDKLHATPAHLAKEIYLPKNSKTLVPINLAQSGLQVLSVSVDDVPQLFPDELLVDSQHNKCYIYLTNIGQHPMKLPRGTKIGVSSSVHNDELLPWNEGELNSVAHTSPIISNPPPVKKVKLTQERKQRIIAHAKLDHLSPQVREKYLNLLLKFHDIISVNEFEISRCRKGRHAIPLKSEAEACYVPQFPLPQIHKDEILRQVKNLLQLGLIRSCESNFNSPLFLVKKKSQDGKTKYRIVQDLRRLNHSTSPSQMKIPLLSECMDRIAAKQPKLFSSIDLRHGFHQVELDPKDQHKTAFWIEGLGQMCWVVASQGLTGMPFTFQRIIERCFRQQIAANEILVYLDDILGYAKDHNEMLRILEHSFSILRDAGLSVHLQKCEFGVEKLVYLGFELDGQGYRPDPAKTKAILECPPPSSLKGVRAFIGMMQFYRSHFSNFSQLIKPLSQLTSNKANWSGGQLPPNALAAFEKCRKFISKRPILAYPDFNLTFHLYVDGSVGELNNDLTGGLSAMLVQFPNNDKTQPPRILGFASKTLLPHERNYSAFLIENAAAVFGVEHFTRYLLGQKWVLHTDHKPLCNLNSSQKRTLERFREILANYDFDLEYMKGTSMPSDFLSRYIHNKPAVNSVLTAIPKPISSTTPFSIDPAVLKQQQNDDPFISSIKEFIHSKSLPNSQPLKSLTKKFGPSCFLKNGLVMRQLIRPHRPDKQVLLAPGHIHASLIAEAHGSIYAGHHGEMKTTEKILEGWWWPSLFRDVADFLQNDCTTCATIAPKDSKSNTYLQPLEAVHIFERLQIDLYGPLHTDNGKKFILVIIDAATKYAEFVPIPSKEPDQVAEALFNRWFMRFGLPRVLLSDKGREFDSKLIKALCKNLSIDQRFISTQHPRCNSQCELVMKKVTKYLKSMTYERPLDWERHVPALQFSWNTSVSSATKASPFSLLFGVDARNPINDLALTTRTFYGSDHQTDLMKRLQLARKIALDNNASYRADYKKKFDAKVTPIQWQEGMLVFLHSPESQKVNRKVSIPWVGPYVILTVINHHNVVIQHLETRRTKVVNVNRLKPYNMETKNLSADAKMQSQGRDAEHAEKLPATTAKELRNSESAQSGPTFADFFTKEVQILNPSALETHRPIPIKQEGNSPSTSETSENPIETTENEGTSDIIAGPSSSKAQSPWQKFKQSVPSMSDIGAELAQPLRMTRKTAKDLDVIIPDQPLHNRGLEYLLKPPKEKKK